jgi:hypothetical protein
VANAIRDLWTCLSLLIWSVKIENVSVLRKESKPFHLFVVLSQIEDHGCAVSRPAIKAPRLFVGGPYTVGSSPIIPQFPRYLRVEATNPERSSARLNRALR